MTTNPDPILPHHMQINEAAAFIGISRAKLDRLRVDGFIGSYVEGRNRFFATAELQRWCDRRAYEPPTRGDGLTHVHLMRRVS